MHAISVICITTITTTTIKKINISITYKNEISLCNFSLTQTFPLPLSSIIEFFLLLSLHFPEALINRILTVLFCVFYSA